MRYFFQIRTYIYPLISFFFLAPSIFAQEKLAVIKVRNGHSYNFTEGKKILCKTYNHADSIKVNHTGTLNIITDSVIAIGADTLQLNEIVTVKKIYSPVTKFSLSCLFTYLGCGPMTMSPLGFAAFYWSLSQGIDDVTAVYIGVGVAYLSGFILDYIIISETPIFHSYNKIGSKYKLCIIK